MEKAGEIYTYTDACRALDVAPDNLDDHNLIARTPDSLVATHDVAADIIIKPLSPDDFISQRGGATFDFEAMKADFTKVCPDCAAKIKDNTPLHCLSFASEVLYVIGPESRKVAATKRDKIWKLRFVTKKTDEAGKAGSKTKVAFVSTYKMNQTYVQSATGNTINLSVRHASLIAMVTFNRVSIYSLNKVPSKLLLTPLAGAVWSSTDLPSLGLLSGLSLSETLLRINSSCASGDHVLPDSRASIALAAVSANTSRLPMKGKADVMMAILHKTAKQYDSAKKEFDEDEFKVFSVLATGGLPNEITPKRIRSLYKKCSSCDVTEMKASVKGTLVSHVILETEMKKKENQDKLFVHTKVDEEYARVYSISGEPPALPGTSRRDDGEESE